MHRFRIILLLLVSFVFGTSSCTAFGSDPNSLFSDVAAVIDLHQIRLTLTTPAADRCPWVILLYDSMCGHCREFAPRFAQAAQSLARSGFLVGAINCAADEKLCVASGVSSVPVVFVGNPKPVAASVDNPLSNNNNNKNGGIGGDVNAELFRDAKKHVEAATKNGGSTLLDSGGGGLTTANMHHGWIEASKPQDERASGELDDTAILHNVHDAAEFILHRRHHAAAAGAARAMDVCKEVARTLMLRKFQVIEHNGKSRKNSNNAIAAGTDQRQSSPSSFVPPKLEPCRYDLVGALFVAMRHEVVVAPASRDNWWTLLRFLEAVHEALPDLGADKVLGLLRVDRQAPHRPDWGAKLEAALSRQFLKVRSNNNNNHDAADPSIATSAAAATAETTSTAANVANIEWHACRGSTPNFRGYSCGLWMLFHAVLANSPRGKAGLALQALHDYVCNFFMCLECRVHFSKFQLDKNAVINSGDDVAANLWLYNAHNDVNRRLEHSGSTDPLVPKVQFPPKHLMSLSASDTDNSNNAKVIMSFLRDFYSWENIRKCTRENHDGDNDDVEGHAATPTANGTLVVLVMASSVGVVLMVAFVAWRQQHQQRLIEEKRVD